MFRRFWGVFLALFRALLFWGLFLEPQGLFSFCFFFAFFLCGRRGRLFWAPFFVGGRGGAFFWGPFFQCPLFSPCFCLLALSCLGPFLWFFLGGGLFWGVFFWGGPFFGAFSPPALWTFSKARSQEALHDHWLLTTAHTVSDQDKGGEAQLSHRLLLKRP